MVRRIGSQKVRKTVVKALAIAILLVFLDTSAFLKQSSVGMLGLTSAHAFMSKSVATADIPSRNAVANSTAFNNISSLGIGNTLPDFRVDDELLLADTATTLIAPPPLSTFVRPPDIELDFGIQDLEAQRGEEFDQYFGQSFTRKVVDPENIRYALYAMHRQVPSIKPAVVYLSSQGERVFIRVETADGPPIKLQSTVATEPLASNSDEDFYPEEGSPPQTSGTRDQVESESDTRDVSRSEVIEQVELFWREVQNPESSNYLEASKQLYKLLIAPIRRELRAKYPDVNTLLFSMENGLRLIPLAALYDEEDGEYLTEQYQLSVIPRFSALDLRPSDLSNADVLAMGISEFRNSEEYAPLSAVPLELKLIQSVWSGGDTLSHSSERRARQRSRFRANSNATLANLRQDRREHPFQIIHLATHANFNPGVASDSNIQLWDTTLPLNPFQIETLNWNNPPVDLLVLSACRTALGDESAELGFAGLSLQAEVKSTLASLWYVGDLSTLVYMMEFYRNLRSPETGSKAEAVQKTQLAMLSEERLKQNLRELRIIIRTALNNNDRLLIEADGSQSLTETELQGILEIDNKLSGNEDVIIKQLSHPYSWSAFTLVGSPW